MIQSTAIARNTLTPVKMYRSSLTGHKCFTHLKYINPNIKVIVLTGFLQQQYLDELIKAGVCGYISKPYRIEDLSKMINHVIST